MILPNTESAACDESNSSSEITDIGLRVASDFSNDRLHVAQSDEVAFFMIQLESLYEVASRR